MEILTFQQREARYFSMSQLQKLAMVYFDNQDIDNHKKLFAKDYLKKSPYKREARPTLMIKSIVW